MHIRYIWFALVVSLFLVVGPAVETSYGQVISTDEQEYQLKAGFLFNFLKFVSIPEDENRGSDIWRIGVIGDNKLLQTMRRALAGKEVDGLPVEVAGLSSDVEMARLCHIVFVADDFAERSKNLLEDLEDEPVLVVGESKDFARQYGIIGFVIRKKSLRLEINPTRARNADLIVSGKLSSLAELVVDRK